ncbi:MAG TPA: hypothetical protein VFB08_04470 [Burkholderiales bacterium]|nr:hypothetical protein [Burkholderiales bacterium]
MKRTVLFALSALVAGAMTLPVYAAGTNEKNPDSAATGMTGTGSNAMDKNSNTDRSATGASSTGSDTSADTDTTHAKSKRKARHAKKSPDAATNHGAVGGESAGKSSDSPAQ